MKGFGGAETLGCGIDIGWDIAEGLCFSYAIRDDVVVGPSDFLFATRQGINVFLEQSIGLAGVERGFASALRGPDAVAEGVEGADGGGIGEFAGFGGFVGVAAVEDAI